VIQRLFPDCAALFEKQGWQIFRTVDRVYVNALARRALGWRPAYDFTYVLRCLREGRDFRSPLALTIGAKGYHDRTFAEGPYPVAS
jgi:UDP-glucose 4-epimerase